MARLIHLKRFKNINKYERQKYLVKINKEISKWKTLQNQLIECFKKLENRWKSWDLTVCDPQRRLSVICRPNLPAEKLRKKTHTERFFSSPSRTIRRQPWMTSSLEALEYNIFVFWNPGIIRPTNYDCIDFCK